MRPYALPAGTGRIFHYDIDFTVKVGEQTPGRGVAILEYTTRQGEEPPLHTHPTEDEIFYVLEGELQFVCNGEVFELGPGGMVYLPQGLEHGYRIRSSGDVRLLVITAPPRNGSTPGWGGYVADIETQGTLRS